MIAARQIFLGRGGAKLPYDAEVEYLESTGTQYIDTGIALSNASLADITWVVEVTNFNDGCMGSFGQSPLTSMYVNFYSSKFYMRNMRTSGGNFAGVSGFNTIRFAGGNSYLNGTAVETDIPLNTNPTNSMFLFAYNRSNAAQGFCKARVSSFVVKVSDVLIADFIPVRIGTEGAMYDRVSGQLFRNAGTGAFTYGGDVYSVPVETSQYVQDGLVAMWDGKENYGIGKRCDTATSWVDCIGNLAASVSQCRWLANSVRTDFQGQTTFPNVSSMTPTDFTYEIVIQMQGASSNDHRIFFSTASTVNSPYINEPNTTTFQANARAGSDAVRNFTGDSAYLPHSLSFATDSNGVSLYTDGSFYRSGSTRPNVADSYQCPRTYDISALDVELAAFRIYSRALTAAEIAANYAVDKQRFNLP